MKYKEKLQAAIDSFTEQEKEILDLGNYPFNRFYDAGIDQRYTSVKKIRNWIIARCLTGVQIQLDRKEIYIANRKWK